jgi:C-terminal processing protease CtpA/Prc
VATALFATGLLCGAVAGRAAVARAQDPYLHLDLFARVLTTVRQDYVEEIPTDRLVDAAIEGMLTELDDQSQWLDGDQVRDLRAHWEDPVPADDRGAPAARPPVWAEPVPGRAGVVYVRVAEFQDDCAGDLVEAVAGAVTAGAAPGALVLDLRDNPGGLLSAAVAVTDLFLDAGVVVRTEGRHPSDREEHRATAGGFPPDMPVRVLANGMSASASEIVVAALQETGRALIVGERTYGKGTVQQVYLHGAPEDAALKLTVGRYTTPSGAAVAPREGRPPDLEVPWPSAPTKLDALGDRLRTASLPEEQRAELLALVHGLRTESVRRSVIPWDQPLAIRLDTDPQLQAALDSLP